MEKDTADWYRNFAEVECKGQSELFANWALGISGDRDVLDLIETLPLQKRQPNLIFAVSRVLGAPLESYNSLRAWLIENWNRIAGQAIQRSTQTNEPRRCAALLPALGLIDEPIALIELGASAGLCLIPDRYSYRFTNHWLHPEDGPSLVKIESEFSGAVPFLRRMPNVQWRAGADLNPLSVLNPEDVRWLETLIWPEQEERLERVQAAMELARRDPPRIIEATALEGLQTLSADAPRGLRKVVLTPAVLVYLPYLKRMELVEAIRSSGASWISLDALNVLPEVDAKLRKPKPGQFTLSMDGEPLARVGPHGQFVDWL
ncbi:MAG: DUF2332 domain-containing protein [Cryobacterium sp.]|nr:DUF2332 domain-containing protein [Cryobacterium sp.]